MERAGVGVAINEKKRGCAGLAVRTLLRCLVLALSWVGMG
jgi:hypothetical protein